MMGKITVFNSDYKETVQYCIHIKVKGKIHKVNDNSLHGVGVSGLVEWQQQDTGDIAAGEFCRAVGELSNSQGHNTHHLGFETILLYQFTQLKHKQSPYHPFIPSAKIKTIWCSPLIICDSCS